MNLPDGFLKEEVICDYKVSEKNKKIMAIELDLAQKLVDVCTENDITIFAYAGTMLGAIRHKGFIPWDDDMDFAILAKDLPKLEKLAKEFTYPYFLQTAKTDKKYFCGYARLRNSESTGRINWHKSNEYNNGIYVDIYVLNGLVDDSRKLKAQIARRDFVQKLLNMYYSDLERTSWNQLITTCLKYTLLKLIPYESLVDVYRRILSKYDDSANKYTVLTHYMDVVQKCWCYKEDVQKVIFVPFENTTIPVPENYTSYLTHHYGDYMQLPKVEERGIWHESAIFFEPDIAYKDT